MRKEIAQLYGAKILVESENEDSFEILRDWYEEAFAAWAKGKKATFALGRRDTERYANLRSPSGRVIEAVRCLLGRM
jgi:hypothetical protein